MIYEKYLLSVDPLNFIKSVSLLHGCCILTLFKNKGNDVGMFAE